MATNKLKGQTMLKDNTQETANPVIDGKVNFAKDILIELAKDPMVTGFTVSDTLKLKYGILTDLVMMSSVKANDSYKLIGVSAIERRGLINNYSKIFAHEYRNIKGIIDGINALEHALNSDERTAGDATTIMAKDFPVIVQSSLSTPVVDVYNELGATFKTPDILKLKNDLTAEDMIDLKQLFVDTLPKVKKEILLKSVLNVSVATEAHISTISQQSLLASINRTFNRAVYNSGILSINDILNILLLTDVMSELATTVPYKVVNLDARLKVMFLGMFSTHYSNQKSKLVIHAYDDSIIVDGPLYQDLLKTIDIDVITGTILHLKETMDGKQFDRMGISVSDIQTHAKDGERFIEVMLTDKTNTLQLQRGISVRRVLRTAVTNLLDRMSDDEKMRMSYHGTDENKTRLAVYKVVDSLTDINNNRAIAEAIFLQLLFKDTPFAKFYKNLLTYKPAGKDIEDRYPQIQIASAFYMFVLETILTGM